MERKSVNIAEGTNKWIWLTANVRKGTSSGVYTGEITITPAGKPESRLELVLQVLPFELPDRVEDKGYAILAHWPPPLYYGDVWENYAKHFPVLKAHDELTAGLSGKKIVIQGGPGAADMETSSGGGGKTHAGRFSIHIHT